MAVAYDEYGKLVECVAAKTLTEARAVIASMQKMEEVRRKIGFRVFRIFDKNGDIIEETTR